MSEFSVKPEELRQAAGNLNECSQVISRIGNETDEVKKRLIFSVEIQKMVGFSLRSIAQEIRKEADGCRNLSDGLTQSVQTYQKTEELLFENANRIGKEDGKKEHLIHHEKLSFYDEFLFMYGDGDGKQTPWDFIKAYLTKMSKADKDPYAGLMKDGLSYLKSLGNFFFGDMKGMTGAKELCDLAESSCDMWNGLYSFLKKFDPTKTSDGISQFVEKWGKISGGIGIAGSGIGLIGSFISAFDCQGESGWDIAAGFLDTGGDVAGFGKSIYEYRHLKDISKSKGLYTSAGLYVTLAETTTSFFSETLRSIEKYSADGMFDIKDTSATMIDGSVSGLYKMVESLTFGIISENTTGVSSEDISNHIQDFGKNLGNGAGEYAMNNPDFYQEYQNAGKLKQFGMTWYAIIKGNWK